MSWPCQSTLLPCLLGEIPPAFYEPFRRFVNKTVGYSPTDQIPWTSLIAGASSGAVGGEAHSPAQEFFLTLHCSVTWEPHVLDQGSDAGTYLIVVSQSDAQIIPRHILLPCQSEPSTTTRTRGKLLREYSKLRVSAAFSAVWTLLF